MVVQLLCPGLRLLGPVLQVLLKLQGPGHSCRALSLGVHHLLLGARQLLTLLLRKLLQAAGRSSELGQLLPCSVTAVEKPCLASVVQAHQRWRTAQLCSGPACIQLS